MAKTAIRIDTIIRELLGDLPDRQKDILSGRFGLTSDKSVTLAKLGNTFGITRERVRQIESLSLDTLKKKPVSGDFRFFIELVSNYLKNAGGLKREDMLLEDLRGLIKVDASKITDNQIRFLLETAKDFSYSKETAALHPFWYQGTRVKTQAQAFIKDLLAVFKGKKIDVINAGKFDELFGSVSKKHGLEREHALNFASISKKFGKNPYGEYGLSKWREINPKTARDWAHLVLRKEEKPLHFTDIAKIVNDLRNDKKIHHQTIHNELIKDDKFVLVGKGMYGLKEFGLIPGTARDVIRHLIEKHGPLSSEELLDLILKERFVKPNTVLINLQSRKHFERLTDGRYTIREA